MFTGVIVALAISITGQSYLHAIIVQPDGTRIEATNDNQVINAMTWQEYTEHPYRGSCTLYEDFSLGGACSVDALDPDIDESLNGEYVNLSQSMETY